MSDDEDLAPRLDALADDLDALRSDLDPDRPPRVRDLLRFTERYTIPALIAILEANVRLLELTAASIRLADGRLDEGDSSTRAVAVDALDRALEDLGGALRGVPTDADARRLVEETRDLRREIGDRIEESRTTAAPGQRTGGERTRTGEADPVRRTYRVPVESAGGGEDAGSGNDDDPESAGGPAVDVDAELESIKRELDEDAEPDRTSDSEEQDDDGGEGNAGARDRDADDPREN